MINVHVTCHENGANGRRRWFIFQTGEVETLQDLTRLLNDGMLIHGYRLNVERAGRHDDRVIVGRREMTLSTDDVHSIGAPYWPIQEGSNVQG